jgi:hypothetical protein
VEVFRLGNGEIGKRIIIYKFCDVTCNLDSRDLCGRASGRAVLIRKTVLAALARMQVDGP